MEKNRRQNIFSKIDTFSFSIYLVKIIKRNFNFSSKVPFRGFRGIILFLFFANLAFGQNDSIPVPPPIPTVEQTDAPQDTISKKKKNNFIVRYFREGYPNPKKAAILSLILPGTGQIYNKKGVWYKLPIVYGGLITGIYLWDRNTRGYKELRDNYKYLVDDDDATISIYQPAVDQGLLSASTIKSERIRVNKLKQLTYAGFVAGYLLVASEAYVTAHLLSFDVSDDLSLQINPKLILTPDNQLISGVGMKFNIKSKQKEIPKFGFSYP